MNKKILISLATIAAIAAIAIGGTVAFFSNTEKSTGNTFMAGEIDLTVDNECHYNGNVCSPVVGALEPAFQWVGDSPYPVPGTPCECTWVPKDLDGTALFNFTDIKPGDKGEDTISLHVATNPAWICAEISEVANMEMGCNIPEGKVDTTCDNPGEDQGELWDALRFNVWMDDCDNIYEPDANEIYLVEDVKANNIRVAIADASTPGAQPITSACIGVEWYVDGPSVGNEIQSDSVTGQIVFEAYQARNNPGFLCNEPEDYCGDGDIDDGEQCDDGLDNGISCTPPYGGSCNYCSNNCEIVTLDGGYCGNQVIENGEACDGDPDRACTINEYNGLESCEGCQWSECRPTEWCGDGILNDDEQCDGTVFAQPYDDGHYTCDQSCQAVYEPYCGDGYQDPGEECDDGGNVDGDGCNAQCVVEYCGDGIIQAGLNEQCDDGNTSSNDYCSATCQNQGALTVHKTIVTDNGGDLTMGEVTLKVDGAVVSDDQTVYLLPGTHTFYENGIYGYSATYSGDCNTYGNVSIVAGQTKSCTLTNNDIAPTITVVKSVVGGSADPDDFDPSIDGNVVISGSTWQVLANTAHSINEETSVSGYTFTSLNGTSARGVSCPAVLGDTITLGEGDQVTCTITNTY